MAILKYESWDSVTAPAVPGGWNLSTPGSSLVTTTTAGTISPTSSPNMLESVSAAGAYGLATWGTADGVSGNVTVQSNIAWIGVGTKAKAGVMARGSASTLNFSTTSQYLAYCDPTANIASISKVISGVLTDLFTATITGLLATDAWYQFSFTPNGTSLSFYVLRLSDSKWLTSSGWVAGSPVAVTSGTDSSLSGSGYAGLLGDDGGTTIVFDDFYLTSVIDPHTHATMYDRVKESTATTGTGPLLLLGAQIGYRSFSVAGDGNYVYYGIQDTLSGDWEVGLGTWNAAGPLLHRLSVYDSSNGGSLVNFQPGSFKDVFLTVPAWLMNSLMGLL